MEEYIEMNGVREYSAGTCQAVSLQTIKTLNWSDGQATKSQWWIDTLTRGKADFNEEERIVINVDGVGGYYAVDIDLLDLIKWLRDNAPQYLV